MKTRYFIIVIIILMLACNTKKPSKISPYADTTTVNHIDTANAATDTHYFWSSEWDTKNRLEMKKVSQLNKDELTPANLIQKINSLYPKIQLRFIKVFNDTIFVSINNSSYLTQQMGSSGAETYLAEVTYNLTELKDVNFVHLHFKEGDHASPGTYARTDFVEINN